MADARDLIESSFRDEVGRVLAALNISLYDLELVRDTLRTVLHRALLSPIKTLEAQARILHGLTPMSQK